MTGCGRHIRYMLEGITYYTPCISHDHDGRCHGAVAHGVWLTDAYGTRAQGIITDWMTQPI